MTDDSFDLPRHPYDVKPTGNAYMATDLSTWSPFAQLPDELLVHILEYLDPVSLTMLGATNRLLYAFCRLEELWKAFCISSPQIPFKWHGTWFSSYTGSPEPEARISCKGTYSDVLYRPFHCAHTPLDPYTKGIPRQNNIPRMFDLSPSEFAASWTDKPFILTNPVTEWPVYKDWSINKLLEKYGKTSFRAESVDWPLETYAGYMAHNSDESPLYLFDHEFVEKMNLTIGRDECGAYWPPLCFGEDLFSVLKDQRPDCRWLIVGPERSGSTFHKDPNATSAWNAVLRGSKYWIMFPSSTSCPPPPGVYVSEDQSEVTSPLSIAEWLLCFHAKSRATPGCLEGICHAGEVLHVPSGWWHLVVNLDPAIAITQNFVPEAHLQNVMAFLRDKPDQVSGFRKDVRAPYELFVSKMREVYPELLAKRMDCLQNVKKRKWQDLVRQDEVEDLETHGFSFNFGDADDDEIP